MERDFGAELDALKIELGQIKALLTAGQTKQPQTVPDESGRCKGGEYVGRIQKLKICFTPTTTLQ